MVNKREPLKGFEQRNNPFVGPLENGLQGARQKAGGLAIMVSELWPFCYGWRRGHTVEREN